MYMLQIIFNHYTLIKAKHAPRHYVPGCSVEFYLVSVLLSIYMYVRVHVLITTLVTPQNWNVHISCFPTPADSGGRFPTTKQDSNGRAVTSELVQLVLCRDSSLLTHLWRWVWLIRVYYSETYLLRSSLGKLTVTVIKRWRQTRAKAYMYIRDFGAH